MIDGIDIIDKSINLIRKYILNKVLLIILIIDLKIDTIILIKFDT